MRHLYVRDIDMRTRHGNLLDVVMATSWGKYSLSIWATFFSKNWIVYFNLFRFFLVFELFLFDIANNDFYFYFIAWFSSIFIYQVNKFICIHLDVSSGTVFVCPLSGRKYVFSHPFFFSPYICVYYIDKHYYPRNNSTQCFTFKVVSRYIITEQIVSNTSKLTGIWTKNYNKIQWTDYSELYNKSIHT